MRAAEIDLRETSVGGIEQRVWRPPAGSRPRIGRRIRLRYLMVVRAAEVSSLLSAPDWVRRPEGSVIRSEGPRIALIDRFGLVIGS